MANYFSNRNDNLSKKATLHAELHNIHVQEKAERKEYLNSVETVIKSVPA